MIQKFCVEKKSLPIEGISPPFRTLPSKKVEREKKAKIYCYAIFLLTLHKNEKISSVRDLFHGFIHW